MRGKRLRLNSQKIHLINHPNKRQNSIVCQTIVFNIYTQSSKNPTIYVKLLLHLSRIPSFADFQHHGKEYPQPTPKITHLYTQSHKACLHSEIKPLTQTGIKHIWLTKKHTKRANLRPKTSHSTRQTSLVSLITAI